jgi:8-oxo-dGTP diphosphatase
VQVRQVFGTETREGSPGSASRYCPRCAGPLSARRSDARMACGRCGFVEYRNPLPGVVVLVVDGDRVLLGRRSPRSYRPGKWGLPGGYVERGENFLSAAIREVREETGLQIRILSLLSVVSNFFAEGLQTLVTVLLAEVTGGRERPGDDLVELAWHRFPETLPDMAFEADAHIIGRYFRCGISGAPVDPRYSGAGEG